MRKAKTGPKVRGRSAQAAALPLLYVVFWGLTGAASATYLSLVISDPKLVNALSTPTSHAPQSRLPEELIASPQAKQLRERLNEAQSEIAQLRTEINEKKEAHVAEHAPAPSSSTVSSPRENETVIAAVPPSQLSNERVEPSAPPYAQAPREPAPQPQQTAAFHVPGVSVYPPPAEIAIPSPVQQAEPEADVAAAPDAGQAAHEGHDNEAAIAQASAANGTGEASQIETGALSVPPAPAPGVRPKPKPVAVVAVAEPQAAAAEPAAVPAAAAKAEAPVKTAAVAPAKAAAKPAAKPAAIGVRLASAPSVDALRATWKSMRERHTDTLSGLTPRYIKQGGAGSYTLLVGPVAKATDVLEICAGLNGESLECALANYEGRAL